MNNYKTCKGLKVFLGLCLITILVPILILIVWTFTGRWPWPNLLPETYSLRSIKEVFSPSSNTLRVLLSSGGLSMTVAILSAIIGTMTSRALVFYDFFGKRLVSLFSIMPILVPGTVFAMGIHIVFLKLGLADSIFGVIIVHLIYTLPYSVSIMTNLTKSIGVDLEIQGYVLGASPLQTFIHISFPAILPGFLASMNMAYITSYSQYFLTLLIGGGKVKTLNLLMVPFISKGDRSLSSVYALLFIGSTITVFIILELLIKKQKKGRI